MSEDGQIKARPTFVMKAQHLLFHDNNSNNARIYWLYFVYKISRYGAANCSQLLLLGCLILKHTFIDLGEKIESL
jgi:hypothetical protein